MKFKVRLTICVLAASLMISMNCIKAQEVEAKELYSNVKLNVKTKSNVGRQSAIASDINARYIAIAFTNSSKVMIFDAIRGKYYKSVETNNQNIEQVRITSNGLLLSLNKDKSIHVNNIKTGKVLYSIQLFEKYIGFALSPDESMFAYGNMKGILYIHSISDGKKISTINTKLPAIISLGFSPDNKHIAVGGGPPIIGWPFKNRPILIFNIKDKALYKSIKTYPHWTTDLVYSKDGKKIIAHHNYVTQFMPYFRIYKRKLVKWDIASGKEEILFKMKTFADFANSIELTNNEQDVIISNYTSKTHFSQINLTEKRYKNMYRDYDIGGFVGNISKRLLKRRVKIEKYMAPSQIKNIYSIKNNLVYIIGLRNGINIIYRSDTKQVVGFLYAYTDIEWAVITPSGQVEGSKEALQNLSWQNQKIGDIPLANTFEQYYTPNLFTRIKSGEKIEEPVINIDDIKLPPLVNITKPLPPDGKPKQSLFKSSEQEVNILFSITDMGGGIDEVRLYQNGKLVKSQSEDVMSLNQTVNVSYKVDLVNGVNELEATAFNKDRTEAVTDKIKVFYEGVEKESNLHMIVIGLNNYQNPKYKLNYAQPDAIAFKKQIEENSATIFENINVVFLLNSEVTKERITKEIESIKAKVQPQDVFIFYYAGHGVMSEEANRQFYIAPYDVTQLYGNNQILNTKAISATELQNFSKDIKAGKQLFILDACQSGGMTDLLASRGAAEEKAIAQLARSTGTYWLTASGSEQFATEFKQLGHGIFTYCLLLGLEGEADGENGDKKVTVKELSSFVEDKVPELSEKYKGQEQYPNSYGYGQDFPIIVVSGKSQLKIIEDEPEGKYTIYSIEQLEKLKDEAVEAEDYEKAAEIKNEIKKRTK
ncbi:caspase family protein [Bacteroidota bacterium]